MTERLTATPANVALGPLDQIADGKARSFVLEMRAGRFHGFVLRVGDTAHGYVDRCPHMGMPLAQTLDDYVHEGRILCSWHGAVFDIASGMCIGGPCQGGRLAQWPIEIRDGTIFTA